MGAGLWKVNMTESNRRVFALPQAAPQNLRSLSKAPIGHWACYFCCRREVHEELVQARRLCRLSQTFLCKAEASKTVRGLLTLLLTWRCAKDADATALASKLG